MVRFCELLELLVFEKLGLLKGVIVSLLLRLVLLGRRAVEVMMERFFGGDCVIGEYDLFSTRREKDVMTFCAKFDGDSVAIFLFVNVRSNCPARGSSSLVIHHNTELA